MAPVGFEPTISADLRLRMRLLGPAVLLISELNLREICCHDGGWVELAEDRVQW